MQTYRSFLLLLFAFFCPSSDGLLAQEAQTKTPAPILFIYDASGSMWGKMQTKTKVEIARDVLSKAIDQLDDNQQIGLVAYGHRKKGDCEDVEYLVDLSNTSKSKVKEHINTLKPLGKTPLAYAALQVIEQLKTSAQKATIILITDGNESCGGNLCEVIQQAREAGIDFKLHIVGFGLAGEDLDPLKCAAQAGSGNYYDAADADELTAVLDEATKQTVDESQESLALFATKNGIAIDAWVKVYPMGMQREVGGVRTYQDTGFISLPTGIYDLVVQPLQGSDVGAQTITGVRVSKDSLTYQFVSFDAGKIKVYTSLNGEGWDATVNIALASNGKSASGGRTYAREKYFDVSPGIYDIKLSALKIKGSQTVQTMEGIVVLPGDTTVVEHNFQTGTARIGALGQSGLMDATINIVDESSARSVGGGRTYTSDSSNPKTFQLTPGKYKVTLVGVREFKGEKRSFDMTIRAGESFEKMVQF